MLVGSREWIEKNAPDLALQVRNGEAMLRHFRELKPERQSERLASLWQHERESPKVPA